MRIVKWLEKDTQNFDFYNNLSVVNVVFLALKSYISQVKRSVEMLVSLSKGNFFLG